MNDELAVVREGENDHFEELAIAARTNHQDLRRSASESMSTMTSACSTAWSTSLGPMPCRLAER